MAKAKKRAKKKVAKKTAKKRKTTNVPISRPTVRNARPLNCPSLLLTRDMVTSGIGNLVADRSCPPTGAANRSNLVRKESDVPAISETPT